MAGTETLADVRWGSWDYQSGIQGYEYAVGSPIDTTLVRDWTPVGGRTELTLRDLNLDPNGPAIISGGPVTSISDSPASPFFSTSPVASTAQGPGRDAGIDPAGAEKRRDQVRSAMRLP